METELKHLNDEHLQEQAAFFKYFAIINDCKITNDSKKEFTAA